MGEGMRTSLLFCPFAKLMLWGGFGNLAGEVEVWSLRKKGIVGKTVVRDTGVSAAWALTTSLFLNLV